MGMGIVTEHYQCIAHIQLLWYSSWHVHFTPFWLWQKFTWGTCKNLSEAV